MKIEDYERKEAEIKQAMHNYAIPGYMQSGLFNYICYGQDVGDFLTALLCNDLMGAMGKADDNNINLMSHYAKFLYNEAPSACYGSPENHKAWIEQKGLVGNVS